LYYHTLRPAADPLVGLRRTQQELHLVQRIFWLRLCCFVGQDCILQAGFSTGLLRAEQPAPRAPMKSAQLEKLFYSLLFDSPLCSARCFSSP
jgi:hypothetical protein